jgi:hypothetical protein
MALFWKPQVVLLVNEKTLLPVLMPLAPARNLMARFPPPCGKRSVAPGTDLTVQ